ncbi:DUF2177 family protein [Brevirhabdus sp.]|uniref:DUF2177 family protein n=1 Tax=Brevirhabdus sp. TaxID=2004514 RepID=UPI004058CB40
MTLIILYLATAAIFLALDFIGLRFLIRPLFEAHIDDMLRDRPRLGAAAVFYLFYIAGLIYFVSWPAMREGTIPALFVTGALFGALAYGTYEFTNFATLRDWSPSMVALDLGWGALLTGFSAAAGVLVARALS